MSAWLRRLVVFSLALLLLPVAVRAQQAPDTSFHANIAKPTFVTQHPTLLFDEAHYNFHKAAGRYLAFAELADADGFRVMMNREPFVPKDLAIAKVLVIANALGSPDLRDLTAAARPAFTPAECDIVHDWVKAGGALLLVSDHAPMGAAAQALAARFGVDFSNGYLIDPGLSDSTRGASTLVFTRANGSLGDHPITQGRTPAERVNRVMTFTGQSLSIPPGGTALLRLSDRATDIMMASGLFNGAVPDSLKRSAAGRAQGVAFEYGKGRVVMFGEAAMLSAQIMGPPGKQQKVGMNLPGNDNRQLALNVLHWLAGALK